MAAEFSFETTVNFNIAAIQIIVICIYKAARKSSQKKARGNFFFVFVGNKSAVSQFCEFWNICMYSGTSICILEHLYVFWNIYMYFGTSIRILEHLYVFWNIYTYFGTSICILASRIMCKFRTNKLD